MRMLLPALLLSLLSTVGRADDTKDAAVEEFKARLAKSTNKDELRQDIATFVRQRVGTPAATQAAELLRKLPSPLDHLDPKTIPELDRFTWQPKELVAVLGEHRGRHGSPVSAVLWTPDGKQIISGGSNGYVRSWDPVTLRQQWRIATGGVSCLAISRDSKVLAVATGTSVLVWDLSAAAPKHTGTFTIATSGVHDLHISSDGKHMAAGVFDGLVHLWHLDGSKATVRTQLSGHQAPVNGVRFAPSGKQPTSVLTTADAKGEIRYWDIKNEAIRELGKYKASGPVNKMDYSPSGHMIAMIVGGDSIVLWPPYAKAPQSVIPKASGAAGSLFLTYSPSGQLASAHTDGTAKTWNMTTLKPVTTAEKHYFGYASSVAWSPLGRQIATGGHDWTVRLWDVGALKGVQKHVLRGHWMGPSSAVFSPDGATLGTASADRTARPWDLSKAAPTQTALFPNMPDIVKGDALPVWWAVFTPDGKELATGGHGNVVKLWDLTKPSLTRTYTAPTGHVGQIVYAPDGQTIVGNYDRTVFAWAAKGGKINYQFDVGDKYLRHVSLSPDARLAISCTGYYVLDKMNQPVVKDGRYVYQELSQRLYELKKGLLLRERNDLLAPSVAATFRPDGQPYVTLWHGPPQLWEATKDALKEGAELKELNQPGRGHPYVFAPDGKTYLTGSLNLVEVSTGKILKTLTFDEGIQTYSFAPDGRHISVALVTGPVYILRLE